MTGTKQAIKPWLRGAIVALGIALGGGALAAVSERDDSGQSVTLARPAQRVVSLAPNITELVFAAGGGARLVGVSSFSDYPEAAKHLPSIGDSRQLDLERLVALKPDLVLVWQNGTPARQIEQLRKLGLPLFFSESQSLEQIPTSLERLGRLMGTEATAIAAANVAREKLSRLGARYSNAPPVRVFVQVSDQPLYTLNGRHIVSDILKLCGGVNIFAAYAIAAPSVGIESVLKENPEAVLGGASGQRPEGAVNMWRRYPSMLAARRGNLFALDGDLLWRAGPRIVDGAGQVCEKLALARQRRTQPDRQASSAKQGGKDKQDKLPTP